MFRTKGLGRAAKVVGLVVRRQRHTVCVLDQLLDDALRNVKLHFRLDVPLVDHFFRIAVGIERLDDRIRLARAVLLRRNRRQFGCPLNHLGRRTDAGTASQPLVLQFRSRWRL